MTRLQLIENIKKKKSFLCIGLDSDISKIPHHLLSYEDPIFEFNKQIIEATEEYCVAYKPNLAFYESLGDNGMQTLQKTLELIPENIFTIGDAKRGDIGNTAEHYAKSLFDYLKFDAVTVNPYMGLDTVEPFLKFKNKWTIVLGLTSNSGASDFELKQIVTENNEIRFLYEEVISKTAALGSIDNLMFVVGATKAKDFENIRKIIPNHFLLVPGVGAQGGSLQEVAKFGMNKDCSLLVNSSRSILYASSGASFAEKAAVEAKKIQEEMKILLEKF